MPKDEIETEQAVATETPAAKPAEDKSELARVRREIDAALTASKPKTALEEVEAADEEPSKDSEVGSVGEASKDAVEDEAPEAEAKDEGSQGRDEKGQFTKKAPFSDALLERAIKAGIPMSEAREYPTESLLKSVVDRLEGSKKGSDGETKSADAKRAEGEAKPADDLDAAIDAIPDEWNKEEYDERIVDTFKTFKEIAKKQQERQRALEKELADLRGKESKDFFAKQLEGVKDFLKGDQTKASAIREEFDLLKAGAAATGRDVPDVELFDKAARLVLGGDFKAEATKKKTEAVGRRSAQVISRAAGQRVTAKTEDPFARVAEWVDQKLSS